VLVGVEEVVDGGVVLVHRLLDHPQPQDARVEVDVARGVARDRRDVMDSVELHRWLPLYRFRSGTVRALVLATASIGGRSWTRDF
jgi:hypothetical protein